MEFSEAKDKFIQSWGALGSSWGINRTMAQIHALLLISPHALCADEIMENLQISRGNANMNIRALIDWGLVYKKLKPGERKEFFIAEKDMPTVIQNIVAERKKRELEPMIRVLDDLSNVEGNSEEINTFRMAIEDLRLFSSKADGILDTLAKSDVNWMMGTFLKLMK